MKKEVVYIKKRSKLHLEKNKTTMCSAQHIQFEFEFAKGDRISLSHAEDKLTTMIQRNWKQPRYSP